MHGKRIPIDSITLNTRDSYYSPLTLSSYLYVNNISTSVFSDRYVYRHIQGEIELRCSLL